MKTALRMFANGCKEKRIEEYRNEKHQQGSGNRGAGPCEFGNRNPGGLERWKRFTTLSVHGINGGGVLDDVTITVDLRDENVLTGRSAVRIEGLVLKLNASRSGLNEVYEAHTNEKHI